MTVVNTTFDSSPKMKKTESERRKNWVPFLWAHKTKHERTFFYSRALVERRLRVTKRTEKMENEQQQQQQQDLL